MHAIRRVPMLHHQAPLSLLSACWAIWGLDEPPGPSNRAIDLPPRTAREHPALTFLGSNLDMADGMQHTSCAQLDDTIEASIQQPSVIVHRPNVTPNWAVPLALPQAQLSASHPSTKTRARRSRSLLHSNATAPSLSSPPARRLRS
ncbi:hypothetical protein FALBO_89 [Fusarium albosuccineum]|uniref:Uncharacterized protein n=1 Tax=Fusarium albosuccineum TaxID=1237068 RepID=A0A8H4LP97_9HYPO|nr:hypothetical protein FALBO_89 [Fusarium albosuccineum]